MNEKASQDRSRFITVSLSGVVTKETLLRAIFENYSHIGPRSALWDFLNADLTEFHIADFYEVAETAKSVLSAQPVHRKVAYATADIEAFMKLCRYANQSVIIGNRTEYAVFRALDEARDWLVKP